MIELYISTFPNFLVVPVEDCNRIRRAGGFAGASPLHITG